MRLLESDNVSTDSRVLSEPRTVSDWGDEKPFKGDSSILKGQFGTMRLIDRDDSGKIQAALLIGKRPADSHYKILLMATRPDVRRQGLMTKLHAKATQKLGKLLPADEYSNEGQAFISSLVESEGKIRGEYWIEDDNVTFADGDVSDFNHEGYVIYTAKQLIGSELDIDIEITKDAQWLDRQLSENKEGLLKGLDEEARKRVEKLIPVANDRIDLRTFAMREWGWAWVRKNSVGVWNWDDKTRRNVASGIGDILSQEGLDDVADEDVELYIGVGSTGKHMDLTLADIKEGRTATPASQTVAAQGAATDTLDKQAMHPSYQGQIGDSVNESVHDACLLESDNETVISIAGYPATVQKFSSQEGEGEAGLDARSKWPLNTMSGASNIIYIEVFNKSKLKIGRLLAGYDDHGDYLELDKVWVSPSHRRKGIASAMVMTALKESGKSKVYGEFTGDGQKLASSLNI